MLRRNSKLKLRGIKVNGKYRQNRERLHDGEYQVIDFKTGNAYETKNSIKEDTQMNVYAFAVQDLYGKLPEKTSLFYLKEDKILDNLIKSDNVKRSKIRLKI